MALMRKNNYFIFYCLSFMKYATQGYLFNKPVSLDAFIAYLKQCNCKEHP